MKFLIKSISLEDAKNLSRRFGYALIFDRRSGQESLVRRLSDGHYPRFHLYIDENAQGCLFSLHLDQKKASYEGQSMHSAEYDGELVEAEVSALISFFSSQYEVSSPNKLGRRKEQSKKEDQPITKLSNSSRVDVLDDLAVADLEKDLDNFNKNIKKKRFLFD